MVGFLPPQLQRTNIAQTLLNASQVKSANAARDVQTQIDQEMLERMQDPESTPNALAALQVQQLRQTVEAAQRQQAVQGYQIMGTALDSVRETYDTKGLEAAKQMLRVRTSEMGRQGLIDPEGFDFGNIESLDDEGFLAELNEEQGAINDVLGALTPSGDDFTLNPGDVRFDARGNPIAGVPAAAPKPTIREGIDPATGQPAVFAVTPEGAEVVPGMAPKPPSGMTLQIGDDGAVTFTQGQQSPGTQKPTSTALETSILASQEGLGRLQEIQRSFDPNFLTYSGRFENWKLSNMEKISPDLLSQGDRDFLTDYSTFTTNAVNNMNRYIKEITGAQMSELEADRLRRGVPDPDRDGPTVFQTKMDTVMRQLMLARGRAVHARNNGVEATSMELYEFEGIIERRADELTGQYSQSGMDGEAARAQALQQVRQEFGL